MRRRCPTAASRLSPALAVLLPLLRLRVVDAGEPTISGNTSAGSSHVRLARSERPLLVGIAGGSGCGKTTLANRIVEVSGASEVAVIGADAYYKTLNQEDHLRALDGGINFDRPEALDLDRLAQDLRLVREDASWPLQLPSYDFVSHQRIDAGQLLERPRAVLVEGLFVFAVPELRELFDLRVFARDDVDTCLVQRLRRDGAERGINLNTALAQYEHHVKPAYDAVVAPSAVHADLVVPAATRNSRGAELIAGWIASRAAATGPSAAASLTSAAASGRSDDADAAGSGGSPACGAGFACRSAGAETRTFFEPQSSLGAM